MRRFATSAAKRLEGGLAPGPAQVRSQAARERPRSGSRAPGAPATRRPGRWSSRSVANSRIVWSIATRGSAPGTSTRRRRLFSTSPARPSRTSTATPSIAPDVVDHGLDRRDLRIREHRQQLEQALLAGLEELVAPVHRRPQRLLALGEVAGTAAQQAEPVVEPVAQHLRREQREAGGRELDRQRQAIEPAADLRDGGGVVVRQLEVRVDDAGAVDEQLHGLELADGLAPWRGRGRRGGSASGGTAKTCSARTWSASRLVARTVSPGQSLSRLATTAAASVTCSRLSSTISIRRSRRWSMSSSCRSPLDDLAEPDGARDRHEDGVRVADAGQVDERRRRPGTVGARSAATRMASVVLPVPPGP